MEGDALIATDEQYNSVEYKETKVVCFLVDEGVFLQLSRITHAR
jgi:hypothetical protein